MKASRLIRKEFSSRFSKTHGAFFMETSRTPKPELNLIMTNLTQLCIIHKFEIRAERGRATWDWLNI